jgi:hypothetical protein
MTRLLGISFMASALALGACGGGGDDTADDTGDDVADDTGDDDVDAPGVTCTERTISTTLGVLGLNATSMRYQGTLDTDLGDGGDVFVNFEFYHTIDSGTDLSGDHDLGTQTEGSYATCSTCILMISTDADGNAARYFFQTGGTLNLAVDPVNTGELEMTLTNATFNEVTIDDELNTVLVDGGECLDVGTDLTFAASDTPADYSCAAETYHDRTSCECGCGPVDVDCVLFANTDIAGCVTAGNTCFANECVVPAANDTCATATAVTVGTPVNSTTVNAYNHFNEGLEGLDCTGYAQRGPDVTFSVNLTAGTEYAISINNFGSGTFDPSISILEGNAATACPATSDVVTSCVGGADAGLDGDPETATFTPATTGPHIIIVDSFYSSFFEDNLEQSASTFTLSVNETAGLH